MVGILVHGDNHFIVRGPLPDRNAALALVREWSLIKVGWTTPPPLDGRHIISPGVPRELRMGSPRTRKNGEVSPAVNTLLGEMSARGITIHNSGIGIWLHKAVSF